MWVVDRDSKIHMYMNVSLNRPDREAMVEERSGKDSCRE